MRTNDPGRPLSREIKQAASANVSTFAREWRFRAMAFINGKRSSVLAERRRYEADVRSEAQLSRRTVRANDIRLQA
ncbi:hypothetical protein ACVINI_006647 [Rhizobium beringeri]|jgi:hypothetical protein